MTAMWTVPSARSSPPTSIPRLAAVMCDGDHGRDIAVHAIDDVVRVSLFENSDSMPTVNQRPTRRSVFDVAQGV